MRFPDFAAGIEEHPEDHYTVRGTLHLEFHIRSGNDFGRVKGSLRRGQRGPRENRGKKKRHE